MTDTTTPGQVTARWWAEQLGAPAFNAIGKNDPVQEQIDMGFAGMVAHERANRTTVTAEQAERFVRMLGARVDAVLANTPYLPLYVDYNAPPMLMESARHAGISSDRFPWKTITRSTLNYVTAALGPTPDRLIWTAPGWERPPCGSRRYAADWSGPLPEVCGLPQFHEEREHNSWIPKAIEHY